MHYFASGGKTESVCNFLEPDSHDNVKQAVGGRPPRYAPTPVRRTLQPIHALHLACGAQRALLPVAVGAMNIHDVRDRQTSDAHHRLMPPRVGDNKL